MSKSTKKVDPMDLVKGGLFQCVEAMTLGMPFEVWKTRMGRFRNEKTLEAFVNVYKRGGPLAFWQGLSPKMVESATKGAVLLFSKESIIKILNANTSMHMSFIGLIAGALGGICQTVVMGPCTFIVTAVVTNKNSLSIGDAVKETFKAKGVRGFYAGGTAIAMRQATNWASRQGFTEGIRSFFRNRNDGKLSIRQEIVSGMLGGALSCWNHPFEVARIQMQASANEGGQKESLARCLRNIVKTQGPRKLFSGVIPRILLGMWQTLCMVTGVKLLDRKAH